MENNPSVELDAHTQRACEMYGVSVSEVTPDMRYAAKIANYSDMYGVVTNRLMGSRKCATKSKN